MLFCIKQVGTYYNNRYSIHHHLGFAYDLFLFIYAGNINSIELEHDESLLPVMKKLARFRFDQFNYTFVDMSKYHETT